VKDKQLSKKKVDFSLTNKAIFATILSYSQSSFCGIIPSKAQSFFIAEKGLSIIKVCLKV